MCVTIVTFPHLKDRIQLEIRPLSFPSNAWVLE